MDGAYVETARDQAVEKPRPVAFAVNVIGDNLASLDDTLAELEMRLQPVLRADLNPEPEVPDRLVQEVPTQAELTRQLASYGSAVKRYRERLVSLLERLEV
jgi:hypothetical protein